MFNPRNMQEIKSSSPNLWRLSLVLLLVILVTGCVSFASVKQTATIGVQLSSQENVFDTAPAFCRIASTNTGDDPNCDRIESDLENWHKVNRVLVAYAKALNAMADDSKEKSYKDDISTMLGAASKVGTWSTFLTSNVTGGISAGVDALIHSTTSLYQRAELKSAIEKNDVHIQNIATGFDLGIAAFGAVDQNIQAWADTAQESIGAFGESPKSDAMKIAYRHLSMAIGANRLELANYKKAIDAFAKAHHDLKEHINNVGDRAGDLEVLQVITKDVSTIFAGINKALTTTK
jgi:hypothetical protein